MLIRLLFTKFVSPKAKKFVKLQNFVVVGTNLKALNEVLATEIENTRLKSCYQQTCLQ